MLYAAQSCTRTFQRASFLRTTTILGQQFSALAPLATLPGKLWSRAAEHWNIKGGSLRVSHWLPETLKCRWVHMAGRACWGEDPPPGHDGGMGNRKREWNKHRDKFSLQDFMLQISTHIWIFYLFFFFVTVHFSFGMRSRSHCEPTAM